MIAPAECLGCGHLCSGTSAGRQHDACANNNNRSKFTMRLTGPDVHLATLYTCESGDSVLTRKKYLCSREEMEAQKENPKD